MQIDTEKFRAILKELDRPQAWVAKRLGVHRATLHHYVEGDYRLPPKVYPRLVAILGTTDFLADDVTSSRETVAA